MAVSKLYNYLQTTPDLKILYTKGSWDRGTTIMISLEKPLPLVGMISNIPGIRVKASLAEEDRKLKGAASLIGKKADEAGRIVLELRES